MNEYRVSNGGDWVRRFYLTVIAAANGESILECWQLSDPFILSSQAGTTGAAVKKLGNVANATYTVLPAKFDGGIHRAPAVQ